MLLYANPNKEKMLVYVQESLRKDAPMPYGYHGRVLHVNLTAGSITVEEPDERFYRRYMGGSAMGD